MKIGDFVVDFLCKIEAIFKKDLTCESRAYGKLIYEKTRGQKSRVRVPLKGHFHDTGTNANVVKRVLNL
jgi:hypothetical protein